MGGLGELALIKERADHLIQRALSWSKLRKKANQEKRVALLFYDYPPGESNVGSGAFLDSFCSLEAILKKLKNEGYDVKTRTAEELRELFVEGGLLNTPKWTEGKAKDKYIRVTETEYNELISDYNNKDAIFNHWGQFPGMIMADEKEILLRGIVDGNIFIGLQPSRGFYEESAKNYHDKFMPPHHQYIGFYKYFKLICVFI